MESLPGCGHEPRSLVLEEDTLASGPRIPPISLHCYVNKGVAGGPEYDISTEIYTYCTWMKS